MAPMKAFTRAFFSLASLCWLPREKRSSAVAFKPCQIFQSTNSERIPTTNLHRISLTANSADSDGMHLLDLLSPAASCDVTQMSGTDLAYIGDVVFELFVRSRYVWPPRRTADLQKIAVNCVRAEYQSQLLQSLKEDFPLSTKEEQILSRGRNAVTRSRNRRDPATYQDSTAFEALVGYMYIDDKGRCQDLLTWLSTQLEPS